VGIDRNASRIHLSNRARGVLCDRLRWFEPHDAPSFALWWIKSGNIPSVDEGNAPLDCLRRFGPTAVAFTIGQSFPVFRAFARRTD
jgi:hypothetical protein